MFRLKGRKKIIAVYAALLIFLVGLSAYLFFDVSYLNSLHAFKQTDINISSLCSQNKSTMIFYYDNNCQSCSTEYSAFRNVTSEFAGTWTNDSFFSPYFCAYDFNVTAYNKNATSVFAPYGAVDVYNSLSGGNVPFVFLGGEYTQYYKIGGFSTYADAKQQLLSYMCKSINNIAPVCAGQQA